jgi:uncharacterized damage-inducible protein DinB
METEKQIMETVMSEKQIFTQIWEREFQTTVKVLKAYPFDRENYKPNEKSRSAKELAWAFALEQKVIVAGAMEGKIDWSKMGSIKMPETITDAIHEFVKTQEENTQKLKKMSDESLNKTIKFAVGPKQEKDLRIMDVLRMILLDQIHHRGQFSVYMRLVGAKVPSIYGPTADEPWN